MALLTNTTAPPWGSGLNRLGLRAVDVYDAYARSRKADYERQLMMASISSPLVLAKIPPPGRGYFSAEEICAIPELARTPKPLPPRANKRLLLCQP